MKKTIACMKNYRNVIIILIIVALPMIAYCSSRNYFAKKIDSTMVMWIAYIFVSFISHLVISQAVFVSELILASLFKGKVPNPIDGVNKEDITQISNQSILKVIMLMVLSLAVTWVLQHDLNYNAELALFVKENTTVPTYVIGIVSILWLGMDIDPLVRYWFAKFLKK